MFEVALSVKIVFNTEISDLNNDLNPFSCVNTLVASLTSNCSKSDTLIDLIVFLVNPLAFIIL